MKRLEAALNIMAVMMMVMAVMTGREAAKIEEVRRSRGYQRKKMK